MTTEVELMRQVREFIRHPHVWPGGYPKVLIMSDGAILCAECARSEYRQISYATRHGLRDGWGAAGVAVHMEGPAECCAHCSTEIEAAYGEPEGPETIEYSVCEDCLLAIAHGETDHDIGAAIKRELAGRRGHFVPGVAPTDEDPDGAGYDEFSWHDCELCRSGLGGSRHGVTLLLQPGGGE